MTMSPLPICPDRAGGSDRPEPTRRGSVERARKPAAPDGPGERDCSGAQRLPAGAGEQGGGLRPRRTGYVKVRDSANGFTAIVQHSLATTQEPQCMDVEGTRTLLPRILKMAELRAQGKNPEEIKRFVADAFAKGSSARRPGRGSTTVHRERGAARPGKGHRRAFPSARPVLRSLPDQRRPRLTKPRLPAFVAGSGTPNALIIVPVPEEAQAGPGYEHR